LQALRDVGVRQLSGGAQQRVAIGRALVREPSVLLFDEPLSHLDASHKVQLRAEIKRLQKDAGVTGVLVTHDQTEAMAMADRVAVMNGGVLQQLAVPHALYDHPANLFVAQFIGEPPMNLFPGTLVGAPGALAIAGDGWRAALPPRVAARVGATGRDVIVGARPEHMRLSGIDGAPADGTLTGRVFFREPRGDVDVVLVRVERSHEGPLSRDLVTVEIPTGIEWKDGDPVEIRLPEHDLHVFDAQSGRNLLAAPSSA
jgi:ABC-type sugar transport system ATPase subunit